MKANSFPHPFLDYKAKGVEATLTGKEKVGERDAFVLVFEPSTAVADQAVRRCRELPAGAHDDEGHHAADGRDRADRGLVRFP